ncbi:hypothetical protein KC887_03690 [Candidatus Kaiserbacteria bacterium]|nr:hypothetical protein [Candidatus Kaiserbacteria bacterium]
MTDTVVAVAWFVGLAGLANALQYFFAITYQKHWQFFVTFYLLGVPGLYFTTSLSENSSFHSVTGMLFGLVSATSFVIFMSWWGKRYRLADMYRADTVPLPYQQLLSPNAASALSKASEIIIQDIVLLIVVSDLLAAGYSYSSTGTLFAVIVFLLHIPSPIILGRIYGSILMVLATFFAAFIPVIIGELVLGFYFVFAFHLLVYMLLLVWSRWMQKKQI